MSDAFSALMFLIIIGAIVIALTSDDCSGSGKSSASSSSAKSYSSSMSSDSQLTMRCHHCGGSGRCGFCHGRCDGHLTASSCPLCNGTGRCRFCHGTGRCKT